MGHTPQKRKFSTQQKRLEESWPSNHERVTSRRWKPSLRHISPGVEVLWPLFGISLHQSWNANKIKALFGGTTLRRIKTSNGACQKKKVLFLNQKRFVEWPEAPSQVEGTGHSLTSWDRLCKQKTSWVVWVFLMDSLNNEEHFSGKETNIW